LKDLDKDRELAELPVLELVGEVIEFWGFRKILGQVWAVLYLAGRPLSAPDLQRRLKASAGAISLALGDLRRWGVVSQTWRPGFRSILYVPETDFWKMVSRVVRERELGLVESAARRLEASAAALRTQARTSRGARRQELLDVAGRVEKLYRLSRFALGVLNAIVTLRPVTPSSILKVADLAVNAESSSKIGSR
jgi:DNA-binding transcriptional regulator GbsR (MarR family)